MTTDPSSPSPRPLHVARIELSPAGVSAVEDYLSETEDLRWTLWCDEEGGPAAIECCCETSEEAVQQAAVMRGLLHKFQGAPPAPAVFRELAPENWTESWKRFFHAERVSPRVWVTPSWESCPARPDDVVVKIDPGMSFGTGQHATTRSCIELIDAVSASAIPGSLSLLDVGCGSGILAIAAEGLGFGTVVAVDNDPVAVESARDNVRMNRPASKIDVSQCDLETGSLAGVFDVVVANILSGVLIANARRLCDAVAPRPGACLILSGLLASQADDVLAAFALHGFGPDVSRPGAGGSAVPLPGRLDRGEWSTLRLSRTPS